MVRSFLTIASRPSFVWRCVCARKHPGYVLELGEFASSSIVDGLNSDLARLKQQPDAAKQLIVTDESKPHASVDPADLTSGALAANVLLNSDEVVTLE